MLFQFVKMTESIIDALKKPDDQAEWRNILQLMYHMRQALACASCGKFVSDPHTSIRESCQSVCSTCRASQDGFQFNSDLNYTKIGFVKLCKYLYVKEMVRRWSDLQVTTRNGPITFSQIILEGKDADNTDERNCLSDRFKKAKIQQKRKPCRCGSGKNNNGRLSCLGQRCTCYREKRGCENCKCVCCKNSFNGSALNEP